MDHKGCKAALQSLIEEFTEFALNYLQFLLQTTPIGSIKYRSCDNDGYSTPRVSSSILHISNIPIIPTDSYPLTAMTKTPIKEAFPFAFSIVPAIEDVKAPEMI